jgi:hypothetical protein
VVQYNQEYILGTIFLVQCTTCFYLFGTNLRSKYLTILVVTVQDISLISMVHSTIYKLIWQVTVGRLRQSKWMIWQYSIRTEILITQIYCYKWTLLVRFCATVTVQSHSGVALLPRITSPRKTWQFQLIRGKHFRQIVSDWWIRMQGHLSLWTWLDEKREISTEKKIERFLLRLNEGGWVGKWVANGFCHYFFALLFECCACRHAMMFWYIPGSFLKIFLRFTWKWFIKWRSYDSFSWFL